MAAKQETDGSAAGFIAVFTFILGCFSAGSGITWVLFLISAVAAVAWAYSRAETRPQRMGDKMLRDQFKAQKRANRLARKMDRDDLKAQGRANRLARKEERK